MDDNDVKPISFRASAEEIETIDRAARDNGLSRAEYMRQRLLKDNDKTALKASEDPVRLLHQVLYALQRIISAQCQIPHLTGTLTLEQLDTLAVHTNQKAVSFLLNLDESSAKLERRLAEARAQQKEGAGAR